MTASGYGAKKLRSGAILLTAAALSRRGREQRLVVKRHREMRQQIMMQHRLKASSSEGVSDDESDVAEEVDDDDEFLPTPNHCYNIRMRLTRNAYNARVNYNYDAGCVLTMRRGILGTAGRLNLNEVMGRYIGPPTPVNYPAWRHVGSTRYSINKFASSEWCHLVADSLGGPSTPPNLVAASFSANTYMAAIEALLQGQSALTLDITVRCSAAHLGEWIFYRIVHNASGHTYDVHIDARADFFSVSDLDTVQSSLQTWLAAHGIKVKLSP